MSRAEKVIITNMCMIENDHHQVLVQQRVDKKWHGITFPGGHVEKNESFVDAVIREVQEETGLLIEQPQLCGTKQFQTQHGERYVVLMYKTNQFTGESKGSEEGEVFWVNKKDLHTYQLVPDFEKMLAIFESDQYCEFFYDDRGHIHIK